MKKLLSLVFITSIALGAQAQDKKFQIGLVLGPTFNWTKIQTTKIEKNGIGNDFIIGIGGNYMFNENIGIASGLQFDIGNFSINYGSDASTALGDVFYAYSDTDIKKVKDGVPQDFTDTTAFQLMSRKFRTKYITIPFYLKFQTSMIGKFKYYGKFGTRISILGGVRMDDTGRDADYDPITKNFTTISPITERTLTNMKPDALKKEASLFKAGIGVSGGAEWNFTGSTFLYAELGFIYGVTPQISQKSSVLVDRVETSTLGVYNYSNLDISNNPQHVIELKIGLLF